MVSSSQKTWRYLDAHLILPMIDFLEEKKLANNEEILKARIKAVSTTGMIDYLTELYQEANMTVPEELASKKSEIMSEFETKQAELNPLLEVMEKNGTDSIKQTSLADFCLKYNLSADILDVMFDYARLSYQVGDYKTSSEFLKIYRILTSSTETQTVPTDRQMRAMWGSIASYIAQAEWTAAAELIVKLIEFFDNYTLPKDKFSYGASGLWLIHWAVVVALKSRNTDLLPLMVKDRFLNTISISSPYLWRYISALVILSPPEKVSALPMAEIANLISKESEASKDPINMVIVDLFSAFNFKEVSGLIDAVKEDYYLDAHGSELQTRVKELTTQIRNKLYQ